MQSVMTHQFSRVPEAEIPRSSFDRSHGYKTTFDAGYLIPVYLDEALPGDTFNMNMAAFARLATPLKPFMDNVYLDTFFFAVPVRLVWSNWERFNGAQDDPDSSTDYEIPQFTAQTVTAGSLSDYMGLPTGVANLSFSSLFHRAYNLIWNEWFRDQNIQDSIVVDTGDGPDNMANYVLRRRGKRHDYFTSALPWPQKGTAVSIPLGTSAPVVSTGISPELYGITTGSGDQRKLTVGVTGGAEKIVGYEGAGFNPAEYMAWGDPTGLETDLTAATAQTINALREAFQLQRLYERDARGGTRYTEIVKAHFGVTSPDARLQRPEYLGGGSTPVNIHPVAGTNQDGATEPQGNLAAFGTTSFSGHGFTKSFTEHCIIIGLVNVRADLTYQQGINRMFKRQTRFDFYWPALSHLGEQELRNDEIYAQGTSQDSEVFGYQERYAEYRYKPSLITGQFRSNHAQSLDIWHLGQEYDALPTLSPTFIEENPPIDRVIATPDEPHFLFDAYFKLKCARPMPIYGVPGMIDHF